MHNSLLLFVKSINETRDLSALYLYLSNQMGIPYAFDDLLRAQLVYSVGAIDKLIHDVIRIGMRDTYLGNRLPTPKYLKDSISLQLHNTLKSATVPPPEFIFETEVSQKLRWQSFQKPSNIAEGLALIWDEKFKWDVIAASMGRPVEDVKFKLNFYSDRRNAIVHESDMDPMTNNKTAIDKAFVTEATDLIENCGKCIVALVA